MNQERLNEIEKPLLHLVERDVVPALGCTEPISLALAAATAAKYLGKTPERIEAKVSPNLMKNGLGVAVPGTGMVGLPIAAAIGALGGDPEGELEVLKHITPEQVSQAKAMLDKKLVSVDIHQTDHILYSEAVLFTDNDRVKVAIQDQHTNIILIEKNGEVVFEKEHDECTDCDPYDIFKQVSAREIFEFSCEVELDKIRFIRQAAALNRALSDEGLRENYGLHIGRTLRKQVGSGLMSDDLLSKIMIETTAASDARMGGAMVPVMSNSGSGNQGICATNPVVVFAKENGNTPDELVRALTLSHLTAIYIKQNLGTLSALCGCIVACTGSSCGITYLMGGDYNNICYSIKNMIANLTGMICDGAKPSCSLKISSGVSTAILSATLSMEGKCVTAAEGIIDNDVDKSIQNLTSIGKEAMCNTDDMVLNIMTNKCN